MFGLQLIGQIAVDQGIGRIRRQPGIVGGYGDADGVAAAHALHLQPLGERTQDLHCLLLQTCLRRYGQRRRLQAQPLARALDPAARQRADDRKRRQVLWQIRVEVRVVGQPQLLHHIRRQRRRAQHQNFAAERLVVRRLTGQ